MDEGGLEEKKFGTCSRWNSRVEDTRAVQQAIREPLKRAKNVAARGFVGTCGVSVVASGQCCQQSEHDAHGIRQCLGGRLRRGRQSDRR